MKALPCWFAHEVTVTATGFHAENTPQRSKKEEQEKQIPETLMYFPICFPFLHLVFVWGCILACRTVSQPLDTQE